MTQIFNSPVKFYIPQLNFKATPLKYGNVQKSLNNDTFVTNPLYENINLKSEIEALAKSNPRINEIMSEYKIPIKANVAELERLSKGHLLDTRIAVAQIYSALPQELKSEVNNSRLQKAAMLHDYGKVLIPETILNKAGELNETEQKIMQQHAELGYELLKNKGLDEETLKLIKYHHQTPDGRGYPNFDTCNDYNLETQILHTADKYTALKEKRVYKDALDVPQSLAILQEDVNNGVISKEVFDALKKGVT